MSSLQPVSIHAWKNNISWDKLQSTNEGHLKINVENSSLNVVNTTAENSLSSIDTNIETLNSKTLNKNGYAQVLLTSTNGIAVKADTTLTVQDDPEKREGWNCINPVSSTKLNLYYFSGSNEIITLGQLSSVYFKGFINVYTEFSSLPFINVYTKPTGSGDAAPWYHSRITYEYDNDNTIGIGEECVFFGKGTPSTEFNNRKIQLNNVVVDGEGLDAEEILYITVSTNSSATQDAVDTTLNILGFNTSSIRRNLYLKSSTAPDVFLTNSLLNTQETNSTNILSNVSISKDILNSLDSKISKGEDIITGGTGGLQQCLLYGRVNTGDLRPIRITPQGDIDVEIADYVKGQNLMADSFPVVIASNQSDLNIKVNTVKHEGATNNISNNATINTGATSALSADISNMKDCNIVYEDTSTSSFDSVDIEMSGDNGTTYFIVDTLYPNVNTAGTKRYAYRSLQVGGFDLMRIRNTSSVDNYNNVNCSVFGSP